MDGLGHLALVQLSFHLLQTMRSFLLVVLVNADSLKSSKFDIQQLSAIICMLASLFPGRDNEQLAVGLQVPLELLVS